MTVAAALSLSTLLTAAAAFGSHRALATIRADSECELAILSSDAHSLLKREDPKLAIALHGFLIQWCNMG